MDLPMPEQLRRPIFPDLGMSLSLHKWLQKQKIDKLRKIRQEIFTIWKKWGERQGLRI